MRSKAARAFNLAVTGGRVTWSGCETVSLSPREREVLALLRHRRTDAEIAEALLISRRTASHHVASILPKLGAPNRRVAGAMAGALGLF